MYIDLRFRKLSFHLIISFNPLSLFLFGREKIIALALAVSRARTVRCVFLENQCLREYIDRAFHASPRFAWGRWMDGAYDRKFRTRGIFVCRSCIRTRLRLKIGSYPLRLRTDTNLITRQRNEAKWLLNNDAGTRTIYGTLLMGNNRSLLSSGADIDRACTRARDTNESENGDLAKARPRNFAIES